MVSSLLLRTTEAELPAIKKNKLVQLIFSMPTLSSGSYHLEVSVIFGIETKLRAGRLEESLTMDRSGPQTIIS